MDDKEIMQIIGAFEPKIKRALYQTYPQERDALSQDLRYKLLVVLRDYDVNSIPGFWEIQKQIEENLR